MFGFSKASASPDVRTLLMITVFDPGTNAAPKMLTTEELSRETEKNLLAFLKGVVRRRKDSTHGEIVHFTLAGLPAARIDWKGAYQGIMSNGVMSGLLQEKTDAATGVAAMMKAYAPAAK